MEVRPETRSGGSSRRELARPIGKGLKEAETITIVIEHATMYPITSRISMVQFHVDSDTHVKCSGKGSKEVIMV